MNELTLDTVIATFEKIKKLAKKELGNGNYRKSINHIETAAELAYMFNWIYTDDDLENYIQILSNKILGEVRKEFTPIKGRIVFYDVLALDNRGLTQQYLRAIISWGVEFLFIFEGDDLTHSKTIIEEIKACSNGEFFKIDNGLSETERTRALYKKISDFKPEKAFLHLYPSSVVAVTVWNSLKEVVRYQINLTDHAFWLGVSCIDYSLEFRNYGCTISSEKRNLSRAQLLIQPYYPILDCKPFVGLPTEIPDDAIKIFTGGAYYKMYGRSDTFFSLLKILIELNAKVIILLAGNGNEQPILKFIKKNKFQNRVFLLGSRSDITHVFENCDIYLSTYPVTGGLMGQYAASLNIPLLSYSSDDIPCNFSEGFLNWKTDSDFKITHKDLASFVNEAQKLIEDKSYRVAKGLRMKKHLITEAEFSTHLKEIVTSNKMEKPFEVEKIDYAAFTNLYLEMENKYLHNFYFLIVIRFKLKSILSFPLLTINFMLSLYNLRRVAKIVMRRFIWLMFFCLFC